MNPDDPLDALFRAARAADEPADSANYAFETRVLARIREERGSGWFTWGWKLSPFFAALVAAAALWCRSYTGIEAEPADLMNAGPDSAGSALVAWLGEEVR